MCCGERFWTVEGGVSLFANESDARQSLKHDLALEFTVAQHN